MEYGQTDIEAGGGSVTSRRLGSVVRSMLLRRLVGIGDVGRLGIRVVLASGIATGRACPLELPGIGRDLGRSGAVLGFPSSDPPVTPFQQSFISLPLGLSVTLSLTHDSLSVVLWPAG